jgi:hypothetical protein
MEKEKRESELLNQLHLKESQLKEKAFDSKEQIQKLEIEKEFTGLKDQINQLT